MDPNTNRDEQIELAAKMFKDEDAGRGISQEDASRLAELVLALDLWLQRGGAAPRAWNR